MVTMYGADDKLSKAGDTATGPIEFTGSPPMKLPSGTSGYVITSDGSGNLTLQPASGGPSLPLTISNGGTGQTAQQAALNALAGATTAAQFLRGNGTNVLMAAIQTGDVPTLNQNTTGSSGSCTGNAATATNLAGGATFPAYTAPKVVTLTDASTVSINAANGNDFRLLMTSAVGSTRALGAPSNAVDGQRIDIMVTQDGSGSQLLTYNSGSGGFEFGTSLPSPTLSTGANLTDILGFIYNAAKSKWFFVAFVGGFS